VITDPRKNTKYTVNDFLIHPHFVVLDPDAYPRACRRFSPPSRPWMRFRMLSRATSATRTAGRPIAIQK